MGAVSVEMVAPRDNHAALPSLIADDGRSDLPCRDAAGRSGPGAPGCWDCSGNISFDETACLALWPLSVGKSVTLTRQDTRRRWQDVIRVVWTETVTVPAGRFQTLVIETQSCALGGGHGEGTQTEWWAPSPGWTVRTLRVQNSVQRNEAILTAHERP